MSPPGAKHRVAICEDQRSYAVALTSFLERDPEIEVAGTFPTAEELIAALPGMSVDLVTMDLEMPGMGGVEGIRRIIEEHPVPILVLSAHAGKGSHRAAEALGAGALEVMPKTALRLDRPGDVWATAARSRIKRLATVRLDRRRRAESVAAPPAKPRPGPAPPARAIGIGASTGGPPALMTVLGGLPADFPLPILIVQHMPAGFIDGLVSWLERQVELPIRVAKRGTVAGPGAWFAPGDTHLMLDEGGRIKLDKNLVRGLHRPSVDVLLESLASSLGDAAVGVVLTGMGRDGAEGVRALRAVGGHVIAQDAASSAVFGMPQMALQAGADQVLPLDEIAPALRGLRVGKPL